MAPEEEPGLPLWKDRAFWLLLLIGLVLLVWCLFLNRISLGGPMGVAPPWVHDLSRPFDLLWSALFGPLAVDDWDTTGQRVRLAQYIRGTTVASVAYLLAAWVVVRRRLAIRQHSWELILVVAITARVLPIFSPPLLETDPYRYLWDGATLNAGVNPYRYSPLEVQAFATGRSPRSYSQAEVLELSRLVEASRHPLVGRALKEVNHPGVPTVYPPVAQGLFALSGWLAPGNMYVLKGLVALVDLGVLALVAWLLQLLGRRRELLLVYAWCPVVLKEFPGAAHYDALASFFLLLSLGLLLKRREGAAGVSLGLAIMGKVYPVLAGLVLFRRYGRRGLAACGATVAACVLPFLFIGPRAAEGFVVFGARWVKNAGLYSAVRWFFLGWDADPTKLQLPTFGGWTPPPIPLDSMLLAKLVLVPLALLALWKIARMPDQEDGAVVRKAYLSVAVLMLTSPVGNPWYLGWILPLAAVEASLAWPLLAGGATAYYAFHFHQGYGFACSWFPGGVLDVRFLEYLPFYALLARELSGRDGSASS